MAVLTRRICVELATRIDKHCTETIFASEPLNDAAADSVRLCEKFDNHPKN